MSDHPILKHKTRFEEILKTYRPSESALDRIKDLHVVILGGATSAGRNTIIEILEDTGEFEYMVSDTTRPMRTKDVLDAEDTELLEDGQHRNRIGR